MEESNSWRAKKNHNKVAQVMTYDAELRIGEMKHKVVVYAIDARIYVRRYEEFVAKFERVAV